MNFVEKDHKTLSSGDSIYTYSYDNLSSMDDIMKFLSSMENKYGKICNITCIKKDNDKLAKKVEYKNIEDFKDNNDFKLGDITILSFSLLERNVVFNLNTNLKIFSINNLEKSLGFKTNDPTKIKYYKNQYDQIIKYDGNNATYYVKNLDSNEWIKDNSAMNQFYDSEYTLVEINYDESTNKSL